MNTNNKNKLKIIKIMNQNELKIGDIFVAGRSMTFINKLVNTESGPSINICNSYKPQFHKSEGFTFTNLREATPEEKHWLECCIKADKFISKEEALASFDPEFVLPEKWWIEVTKDTVNIIGNWFDKNKQTSISDYGSLGKGGFPVYQSLCFPAITHCHALEHGYGLYKDTQHQYTEITFEQFKKYVLKEEVTEEPKIEAKPFEILSIESKILKYILYIQKSGHFLNKNKTHSVYNKNIDTKYYNILSVSNNEGNIFMIGDTVITLKGKHLKPTKIIKFDIIEGRIQAFTSQYHKYGVNIDKIEHYIEPEIKDIQIVKDRFSLSGGESLQPVESILDKAKRLYPIGTKVRSLFNNQIMTIIKQSHMNYPSGYCSIFDTIWFTGNPHNPKIYDKTKWAEIIEDKPKVGDKFTIPTRSTSLYGNININNTIHTIKKIINNVVYFNDMEYNNFNQTVLLKNIKIVK